VHLEESLHKLKEAEGKIREARFIVLTTAPTYVFWRDGIYDIQFPVEQMRYLRRLAPDAAIIAVGPQVTATPDCFADAPVDFLIRGEPDLAAAELIDRILGERPIDGLEGVSLRREGKWIHHGSPSAVARLDDLPDLDYTPLSNGRYGIAAYEASRGCPYKCVFCFRNGFREKYRKKSPEKIRREFGRLRDAGLRRVFLIDETFGCDPNWTMAFCEAVKDLGVRWICQTRADCLDPAVITAMAVSNCEALHIGLESADAMVLGEMGKTVDPESLRRSINQVVDCGVGVFLFCVFGGPGESRASIRKTTQYVLGYRSPHVEAHAYEMMPFPGTPLWERGRKEGLPLKSWEDVPKFAGIIGNQFRKPEEVTRECDRFNRWMEWKRLRAKPNLTLSERYSLLKVSVAVRFPFLIGLRGKIADLLGRGERRDERER
jgi:radical SAM superfamily enzyme YgiQ (UPF0313 family)